jgi:hypothetical protein
MTTLDEALDAIRKHTKDRKKLVGTLPKREWVGLTHDDVGSIEQWVMFKEAGSGPIPVLKLIAYIEAKLKEKNT